MMKVVAIDQGTSSTRALVADDRSGVRVAHTLEHDQHYPETDWVEHDAEQLFKHVRDCIEAAGPVDTIGIDNQGESCLAWRSDTKEALSPIIVWQDKRTLATIEALQSDGVETETLVRAGLPLDPYFSASKLGWLLKHNSAVNNAWREGCLRLGTTDAFFLDRLTDRYVTDITTASRTSLMNLDSGQWDPELCKLFGVPIDLLPEIVPSTGDFGVVSNIHGDTPITASIVDQQAALYGFGCRKPGDVKVTFGTGAFALMVTGQDVHRQPEKGLLPTVAWQKYDKPPVYALDGGVYTASAAINWARSLGLFRSFKEINEFDFPAAIDSGLAFVPALAGLGCPHWDPRARGQWLGLSLEHPPQQLVQSILEGVAFRAAEVVDAMGACVERTGPLLIDGGMSKNPYFAQFLSDILASPVSCAAVPELTGIGTAQLAAESLGNPLPEITEFVHYHPQMDKSKYRSKFSDAVAMARQWTTS